MEQKKSKDEEVGALSGDEVEELVVKLARRGTGPSMIGMILRDQHGVPDVKAATGKSILQIMKKHELAPQLPEDLKNVMAKAVKLYSHMAKNPKDFKTKRALAIIESRINRLARYYKRKKVLPAEWRYDRESAALLVRV
ncbi:MAG: 30S ribosomal protein S15 [Candidatus Hadarchaeales archaeon]